MGLELSKDFSNASLPFLFLVLNCSFFFVARARLAPPRRCFADGRVVSNFIMQALSGEDITIYGDGGQTRSFCFVDDLIEGLVRLMNNDTEVCSAFLFYEA